jgi:hypothetical protein
MCTSGGLCVFCFDLHVDTREVTAHSVVVMEDYRLLCVCGCYHEKSLL